MIGFKPEILSTPFKIGKLRLKNRIVMPPMCTAFATSTGKVTDRLIEYYKRRSQGNVALINVEFSFVHPMGKVFKNMLGISDDKFCPGLDKLSNAIHENGAKTIIQISHAGRRTHSSTTGSIPVAPSSIPRLNGEVPLELNIAEIEEIIQNFRLAARRAKDSGFDGVMIHMAHGYLIHQFLSALSNKRRDRYGGSLKNRARFALEILKSIREEVGNDFALTCRLCGDEFQKGGINIDEAIELSQYLEANGLDAIEVSAGSHETAEFMNAPGYFPMGFLSHLSYAIKNKVKIPVGIVGRIHDGQIAETILCDGKADFVAVGRALIADPDWPDKVLSGKSDTIRPCISCNQGCIDRMYLQQDISCTVNPLAGRESIFPIKKAKLIRKIAIIGGGPAGLEAAIMAAECGHFVKLYEKTAELGGQLRIASVPPGKALIENLRRHMLEELKRLHVQVNKKVTNLEEILKNKPDYIVVACGGKPILPKIKGIHRDMVLSAWEILKNEKVPGSKIAIIGGGQVGLETADYLCDGKRNIVVLEMADSAGMDISSRARKIIFERLTINDVEIITKAEVISVENEAIIFNKAGLINRIDNLDTVVIAVGTESEQVAIQELNNSGIPYKIIGDCHMPRSIFHAIHDGFMSTIEI